ncbi:MAG: FecR domain-containing protein [Planctomycetes bacterium]|nr:FecR domain-containing protein [Planctomycetota bacterium]
MGCDVIREQLTDYVKNELGREDAELVANHLTSCAECRNTEAETKKSFGLLHLLAPVSPSQDVWSRIQANLDGVEVGQSHSYSYSKPFAAQYFGLAAAAVLLVAVTAVALFKVPATTPETQATAKIERLGDGVAIHRIVDGKREALAEGASIRQGETITMEPGAAAIFSMAGVGRFRLSGGSVLRITGDRSLELEQGEVIADVVPGGRGFTIQTKDARATVLGTLFRVFAAEGRTALTVARGTVSFGNAQGSVAVGAGSQSVALTGSGPCEPVALEPGAADWDLFRSVAPGPDVHVAIPDFPKPGNVPFQIVLSSDSTVRCDARLSDRTYLLLTLTDPSGTVHVERVAAAAVAVQGTVTNGSALIDPEHPLAWSGNLNRLTTPGTWTVSATYASAGEGENWGGFAESPAVRFEIRR